MVHGLKPGIVSYAIVEKDFGLAKPAKILKFELACGAERIVSRDIAYFSVACGAFPPFLLMKIAISSIFWAKFCLRRSSLGGWPPQTPHAEP